MTLEREPDDNEPPYFALRCPRCGTVDAADTESALALAECPNTGCGIDLQITRLKTQSREEWQGSLRGDGGPLLDPTDRRL